MRDTEPWYRSELALKKRLNGPNTQPNARSIRRDSLSFGASCDFSSFADPLARSRGKTAEVARRAEGQAVAPDRARIRLGVRAVQPLLQDELGSGPGFSVAHTAGAW